MASITARSLVLIALSACSSTPDVRVDITAIGSASVTMTLCPPNATSITTGVCSDNWPSFGAKHWDIYLDNHAPAFTMFFANDPELCVVVDIMVGNGVDVLYMAGSSSAICAPAPQCTSQSNPSNCAL